MTLSKMPILCFSRITFISYVEQKKEKFKL